MRKVWFVGVPVLVDLAVDEAGPSSASGAQSLDVFIDLTSSRPKVP